MSRIIIVGAGIAGLAVARQLDLSGTNYRIIERSNQPSVHGCGLALPFNAMRALQHLGLADEVLSVAHQVHDIVYDHADGTELCRGSLRDEPFEHDRFVALKRSELHDVLLNGLQHKIEFSSELLSLNEQEGEINVTTSTGTESYDLVIAADGIHSKCRQATGGAEDAPIDYGYQTWRFLVEKPGHEFQPTYTFGANDMFMHYPVGAETIYCYGQTKESSLPAPTNDHEANIRAVFADYRGAVPDLLAKMPVTHIIPGRVNSVSSPKFNSGRVVFVGDAGTGCPPTLQQGAAKAFEDAISLGRLLKSTSIDETLNRFANERRPSAQWVIEQSNLPYAPAMDMENPDMRAFRDELMRAEGPRNIVGWRELATNPELMFAEPE